VDVFGEVLERELKLVVRSPGAAGGRIAGCSRAHYARKRLRPEGIHHRPRALGGRLDRSPKRGYRQTRQGLTRIG
jgi:hypothetical protein